MKMNSLCVAFACVLAPAFALAQGKPAAKPMAKPAAPAAAPAAGTAAAPSAAGASYRYNYGYAGCGLGGLVLGKGNLQNAKGAQIGAWFLNGVGSQTSAITSGTSGCSEAPRSVARMEQEVFVQVNVATLSKEAAQGRGQTLSAFADVLGCGDSEGFAHFSKVSQERYGVIFADTDPDAVLARYLSEVKNSDELSSRCSRAAI